MQPEERERNEGTEQLRFWAAVLHLVAALAGLVTRLWK